MPFPDTPRVLYRRNPLEQVICQLRFPPILRIASQLPAEFQDRIRAHCPLFEEADLSTPLPLPASIAEQLRIQLNVGGAEVAYKFSSEDARWEISLTKGFLALTARDYERWEQFKEQLAGPLSALIDVYQPSFFSRIGLRYRDVIARSALGLDGVAWAELLQPHVAAELADPTIAKSIEETQRRVDIRLGDDHEMVRLRQGLTKRSETDEESYIIDSDFFTEARTEVHDAEAALDRLNQQSGRLFRWCISPRLHDAMEPQPL